MIEKLTTESRFFFSVMHNMRTLLITNMLYMLVLQVVEILMADEMAGFRTPWMDPDYVMFPAK